MKIKQIDLVNRQYAMGYLTYSGILNITTYHGDLDGIELDPHVIVLDYPGMPSVRTDPACHAARVPPAASWREAGSKCHSSTSSCSTITLPCVP